MSSANDLDKGKTDMLSTAQLLEMHRTGKTKVTVIHADLMARGVPAPIADAIRKAFLKLQAEDPQPLVDAVHDAVVADCGRRAGMALGALGDAARLRAEDYMGEIVLAVGSAFDGAHFAAAVDALDSASIGCITDGGIDALVGGFDTFALTWNDGSAATITARADTLRARGDSHEIEAVLRFDHVNGTNREFPVSVVIDVMGEDAVVSSISYNHAPTPYGSTPDVAAAGATVTGDVEAFALHLEALDTEALRLSSNGDIYTLLGGWDWLAGVTLAIDRSTLAIDADYISIQGVLTAVADNDDTLERKVLVTIDDPADWSVKPMIALLPGG